MNRINKTIVVRFFSIEADDSFFENFEAGILTSLSSNLRSRIFNVRNAKHLIKLSQDSKVLDISSYAVTVVKERNTWQTKATSDGTITGISLNQGIIGDPYFFFVVPSKKILLGFTSGPSGSLKTVGKTMLEQFKNDRLSKLKLNLIPKEKEFSTLNELPAYSSLHFKINSSSLSDISSDAPELIKNLSSAPYIENNMQLSLDLEFNASEKSLSKENVLEIVNYLSDHDGCTVLKLKGINTDGTLIQLDFVNAFFDYRTQLTTRNKFIDENSSVVILTEALSKYLEECV
ncbi:MULTISPECIES: hypothetical protein [unclassified Methylophaga]|uniref:hypothetical protein n=1 Tax=unclassified Methylophaga TaxID=2629249 RepID=UPI000C8D0E1D|nr:MULTISPECIES: hypothetical protein [unclassified Methylophaga]MBN47843.1 hypothetical protein [Methylophaga sp.]|tara:strand:+ start:55967 stop:56833 length:867 start_codon:yes stop_codon:yes gene_type:complete